MSEIGSVQRESEAGCSLYSPQIVVACCVALTALAILAVALSSWANAQIASQHGATKILHYSPYTIILPLIVTAGCAALIVGLLVNKPSEPEPVVAANIHVTTASSPGLCSSVCVKVGDKVEANTVICVIEAMKMETRICSGVAGTITEIYIQPNTLINHGDRLFSLES